MTSLLCSAYCVIVFFYLLCSELLYVRHLDALLLGELEVKAVKQLMLCVLKVWYGLGTSSNTIHMWDVCLGWALWYLISQVHYVSFDPQTIDVTCDITEPMLLLLMPICIPWKIFYVIISRCVQWSCDLSCSG